MDKMKRIAARHPWLNDPLRAAMTARPQGTAKLALGAVLTAAFFAAALTLCSGMEGAAVIALTGAVCTALLIVGAWRSAGEQPAIVLLCLAALAMLAVGAHLAMLDIKPGRYTKVLEPLLGDLWNYELVTAMAWEEGGWSGVYLIVCALFSRLESFYPLYAFKLFDMVCQCLCALAVMRLSRMRGAKPYGAVAGMMACVLAPTMLMNAGLWAQCDATFAMFTLWGLALLLDDHPLAGCVLWGLALGTKLQSAFLFPLLIVLFLRDRVQLRHILALVLAAFLCQIAILLDGQELTSLVGRYAMQIEEATYDIGLADHAPGVYSLMSIASVREFSGMGLYLGIASALLVVMALLRSHKPLTGETLLLAALLLAAGLPLILPQMNARCLYLAGMLAFACAGNARRMTAAVLLELVSLCSYIEAVFANTIMPMTVLSLMAIAAAVLIALELADALCGTEAAKEAQRT
ncbi:MAG: hypothetical protein Q4F18_07410 [Clostridia bacterium]|nr:hypothetical protein [Clostridia bacterium]